MPDPTEPSTEPTPNQQPNPKWSGWPGDNVFRLIVPVAKVGSIIGRKGELVRKLCDETRARVRVLDAPLSTPDRVVLISGKEEPDAPLSPAMDAVIRLFKRVMDLGDDKIVSPDAAAFCSIKLLVASIQAIHLIGKQGCTVKTIQQGSGAVVRVLSEGDLPSYATSDERIVEIQGEAFKVLKALELVLGYLRKFVHDHSVVAVFEENHKATISQDRVADEWADKIYSLAPSTMSHTLSGDPYLLLKRDYLGRDPDLETKLTLSTLSRSPYSREVTRAALQITQTMQVPISYAEDIIGVAGTNIARIRRSSGAILSIQESPGRVDEIVVEIKGTAEQVRTAQELIQDSFSEHRSLMGASNYGRSDQGLRSTYSDSTYPSYASENRVGGYSSYRF